MKKLLSVLSSVALISVAGVSAASAQSFTPATSTWSLSGTLNLRQTLPSPVPCDVQLTLDIDGAGSGTITGGTFAPGFFLCGSAIYPQNFSWPVTVVSSTPGVSAVLDIYVDVIAVGGNCTGVLSGVQFDIVNQTIDVPAITYTPGSPATCEVDGLLYVDPVTDPAPLDVT